MFKIISKIFLAALTCSVVHASGSPVDLSPFQVPNQEQAEDHNRLLVEALFSRDPAKLRRYLQLRDPQQVAERLSREIRIELDGFVMHGTALFIVTRLGRINAIRDLLRFAEDHPHVAEALFRRGMHSSGPLHWLLENRADVRLVVRPMDDGEADFEVIERTLPVPALAQSVRKNEMVNEFMAFLSRHPEHRIQLLGPNDDGETPLHVAVGSGWPSVVSVFLRSEHADFLSQHPENLDLSRLDQSAKRRMLRELLTLRPQLLAHFGQHPQLPHAHVLEQAVCDGETNYVRHLLAFARENQMPHLVTVDVEVLARAQENFEVTEADHVFMEQLWDLNWTGFDAAIDAINLCWNQRLYPWAFRNNRVLIPVVLAAHMALGLTGKLEWPK